MAPEQVTFPDAAAIDAVLTKEMVKANVRISHGREDELIVHWIQTAHAILDGVHGWARRPILNASFLQEFRSFDRYLELVVPGATAIETVSYTDPTGAVVDVAAESYELLRHRRNTYVHFGDAFVFPLASDTPYYKLEVRYTAGLQDNPAAVLGLKQGMLLLASHWYKNREETVIDPRKTLTSHKIEFGLEKTLGPFRVPLKEAA